MGKISDAPEGVKPYLWHGLDAQVRGTMKNATADCPVCGREGKMGIQVHSSLFRCNACNWSGNGTEFLRWLIETSLKRTKQPAYEALAKSRGLLRWDTLPRWGVCRSALLPDRWLVPAYSPDGEVRQVYSYLRDPKTNRHRLIGTPTFSHGLCIAGQTLEAKRQDVVVCEGPWDGMAYDEALRLNSDTETTVVAVPGCNVFPDSWAPLFAEKRVWLLYDSDRPRHLCNECGRYIEGYTEGSECSHCKTVVPPQQVVPAGLGGMQNAARVLARATPPPAAVYYLDWGPDGYDPDKPAGYDVRDYLRQSDVIQDRGRLAGELRVRSQMVPEEWIVGLSPGTPKAAAVGMLPTFCDSWPEMIKAWRKALKWTVGLDTALSVMLASVVSTKAVGDQLWVKVVGPASCLDGNTPIHDPVDGTTASVQTRWQTGRKFFVYTRRHDGTLGVAQALPPERFDPTPMYELTFASGRTLTVTGGHRLWDGEEYVSVETVRERLLRGAVCRLPTISEFDLSARMPGVRRWWQTAEDSLNGCRVCPYSCGGPPLGGLGNARGAAPSQADVLEHDRCVPVDVVGRTRTRSHLVRPASVRYSSCRAALPGTSPPHEVECALPPYADSGAGLACWFRPCAPSPQPSALVGTELVPVSVSPVSRLSGGESSQPNVGIYRLAQRLCPVGGHTPLLSSHCDTKQLTAGYAVGAIHAASPDVASLPPPLDTSAKQGSRPSCVGTLQPRSCQTDTGGSLPHVALDSRLQPSRILRVDRVSTMPVYNTLPETDAVVKVTYVGDRPYYDFHVPETNTYWAAGYFHHNCGKSTLCEALSVSRKYVKAVSTIRGFHSGYITDREGAVDNSLVAQLGDKTLIIKDGDTLMKSPNVEQILSEARDIYDRVSRTSYRNAVNREYHINMTMIICGTSSIRAMDQSELGERFVDCVIMDDIDDELEDEILLRVVHKASRNMSFEANGKMETQYEPELAKAMQLTGGYVEYLRENAHKLLQRVKAEEADLRQCHRMAKLVSFMRARPSLKQDEAAEREASFRLAGQMVRLATSLAAVLGKTTLDEDVMNRTRKVALDTARGRTLELAKHLYREREAGTYVSNLAAWTGETEVKTRVLLKFLRRIGAVDSFAPQRLRGNTVRARWRLTARMERLYREVVLANEPGA